MSRERVKETAKKTEIAWLIGDDEVTINKIIDMIYDDFEAEIAKLKAVQPGSSPDSA